MFAGAVLIREKFFTNWISNLLLKVWSWFSHASAAIFSTVSPRGTIKFLLILTVTLTDEVDTHFYLKCMSLIERIHCRRMVF